MIEQELFKKHFLGRDGFVWWIGQIADATKWKTNQPGKRTPTTADHKGFGERFRVRIMGYHTADNKALPDNDLPWATVMYPVTAGSGGATASESTQLRQGTFVFGFFMDGEDAQVPVIMGVIGYNEYTSVERNVPPVPFLPFDGYEKLDRRAQFAVKETKESVAGVQVKSPGTTGGGAPATTTAPGVTPKPAAAGGAKPDAQKTIINATNAQNQSLTNAQTPAQLRDAKIETPQTSLRQCGPNQMKGLQLDIKNLTHKIELITKDIEKWGSEHKELINSKAEKIQKAMDEASKFVSEKVKWVVKELRKNTIEKVNNAVKDTFNLFFPNERPGVKKIQDKALSGLSCVFDKVIKGLLGLVGKFLKDLVSKIVNTAICVIENFVGGLLGKLSGFISGAVDSILGPLNSILGLVGGIKSLSLDVIGTIFDTVVSITGFFKCESKPACAEVDQWSLAEGMGNNGGPLAKFSSIFNKAKDLGSQAASTVNQVKGLASSIENGIKSLSFSDLFEDTCGVGALLCGPPKVSFFGGGGTGAAGNAIVSATGNILGVDITSSGSGYIEAPTIYFDDECGKGQGAIAKVVLTNGQTGSGAGIGSQSTPLGDTLAKLTNSSGSEIIEGLPNTPSGTEQAFLEAAAYASGTTIGTNTPTIGLVGAAAGTGVDGGGLTGVTTTGVIGTGTGGVTAGTTGGISGGSGNDGITGVPIAISLVSFGNNYFDSSDVSTSGGSGEGLTVNIEVASNPTLVEEEEDNIGGLIIDISIFNPGENYRVGDLLQISGGTGGTLRIDEVGRPNDQSQESAGGGYGVAKVIIIDPGTGYLPSPNGDAGGEGRVWNTKDQTVVRRSTLDFDRPYDPGIVINLNPGDTITLPVGSSQTISDTDGNILETIPGGIPYVVSNSGSVTSPPGIDGDIPLSEFPSASNGQYPVTLELEDIYIKNTGINYSPTDKIVMEPDLGAVLQPIFDGNGSVVGVRILRGAEGFPDVPLIYVDTDTGYNAELVPVFKVNRVGDTPEDLSKVPAGEKVISVIDCVGKF